METPLLNFVDSSFEHVLHSYGLHLVSTLDSFLKKFISYYWIIIYHLFN